MSSAENVELMVDCHAVAATKPEQKAKLEMIMQELKSVPSSVLEKMAAAKPPYNGVFTNEQW